MNKFLVSLMFVTLCGCVDLGKIGIHPELKTIYFDASNKAVEDCLYESALNQRMLMMKDDPLPGGTARFNLQDANYDNVAYLDISTFDAKQTSVDFFYARHAPDVHKAIISMISQCKRELNR